jgi:uncharacterized protein YidB (DUF937 family)
MADEFENQGWVKMGVAAAMAKQCASDQVEFFHELADWLERSLPGETHTEKRGGLFAKKSVHKISVELGGLRYVLEENGHGSLTASWVQVVRGIALKTEYVPVDVWTAALAEALEQRAADNSTARDALRELLD